jgi:S1-C subfamily serine protease
VFRLTHIIILAFPYVRLPGRASNSVDLGGSVKFLNLLCAVFLLVLTIGCCASSHQTTFKEPIHPTTEQNLIQYLEDSTVVLLERNVFGTLEASCAGVWISPSTILTAKHCIQSETPRPTYPTPAGKLVQFRTKTEFANSATESHYAIVTAASVTRDLALVQSLDLPSHSIVTLSQKQLFSGDRLHIVGHTNGFEYTYLPGVVSHLRKMRVDGGRPRIIQVFSGVWLGNSGGGAFDLEGNLVGICSFITPQVPHMSFFIHVDEVRNFLKSEALTF